MKTSTTSLIGLIVECNFFNHDECSSLPIFFSDQTSCFIETPLYTRVRSSIFSKLILFSIDQQFIHLSFRYFTLEDCFVKELYVGTTDLRLIADGNFVTVDKTSTTDAASLSSRIRNKLLVPVLEIQRLFWKINQSNRNVRMESHSVCLLVVGDEILKGQVVELNTSRLAKSLAAVGLKLLRVVVIPDKVDEISKEVRASVERFPVVFTAGGVGPTHDDLTYAGIASGLGLELKENDELLKLYEKTFPGQEAARRLATVPSPCDLVYIRSSGSHQDFAVIKAANVYVLPGSPKYFGAAVDAIVSQLGGRTPLHQSSIDVSLDEFTIVDILDEYANRWAGKVAIGSYPQDGTIHVTRITLEGDVADVEQLKLDLQASLKAREAACSRRFGLSHARDIRRSSESQPHVKSALQILQQCYEQYSHNQIFLNFNGGKDCTAVLHLTATVAKFNGISSLVCLYVRSDPFPEVDEFVSRAESFYGLEIIRSEKPMKAAVETLLNERKDLKIGLMGMRYGDPGSKNLKPFAPTDNGWPQMIRANPILDWSYSQVWNFLLEHKIPYCSLYDKGYTSLGSRATTKPNPLLRNPDVSDDYFPAYTLKDSTVERHGRG